ncbi:MAG: insulysin [Chlamydiales bacterium]|jgi:insulysin
MANKGVTSMNTSKRYLWIITVLGIAWTTSPLMALELPFYWMNESDGESDQKESVQELNRDQDSPRELTAKEVRESKPAFTKFELQNYLVKNSSTDEEGSTILFDFEDELKATEESLRAANEKEKEKEENNEIAVLENADDSKSSNDYFAEYDQFLLESDILTSPEDSSEANEPVELLTGSEQIEENGDFQAPRIDSQKNNETASAFDNENFGFDSSVFIKSPEKEEEGINSQSDSKFVDLDSTAKVDKYDDTENLFTESKTVSLERDFSTQDLEANPTETERALSESKELMKDSDLLLLETEKLFVERQDRIEEKEKLSREFEGVDDTSIVENVEQALESNTELAESEEGLLEQNSNTDLNFFSDSEKTAEEPKEYLFEDASFDSGSKSFEFEDDLFTNSQQEEVSIEFEKGLTTTIENSPILSIVESDLQEAELGDQNKGLSLGLEKDSVDDIFEIAPSSQDENHLFSSEEELSIEPEELVLETQNESSDSEDILTESDQLLIESDLLLSETDKLFSEREEVEAEVFEEEVPQPLFEEEFAVHPTFEIENDTTTEEAAVIETSNISIGEIPPAPLSISVEEANISKPTAEASSDSSIYEQSLFVETKWPDYSNEGKAELRAATKEEKKTEVEAVVTQVTPAYTIVEDKMKTPILTPSLVERKTLKLRLSNGLEAYIISDPDVNNSGAALAVEAGSWLDPEDRPGLAHFVEHMLFLGTSQFPDESEYKSFIQGHNGHSNAYTSGDHTTYGFSIDNDSFEEGFERFAWLFIDPLFSESGIGRELQAVDQEFARSIENDRVRRVFVHKEIGNRYHPDTNFHFGNHQSLGGITREEVREWYEGHYSADLMRLVIYTPLPLSKVENLVVKHFTAVKNTGAKAISPQTTLTSPTYDANIAYITPMKDMSTLSLEWELSTEFALDKENKTMDVVAHVLGHEGEESLLAQLKREELGESLIASGVNVGPNNAIFNLEIKLTDKGIHDVDSVIERCFQAISYFKSSGIPPYVFDEVQSMAQTKFQYQSREDVFSTVMRYARELLEEDLESYPEVSRLYENFNPRAVRRLFAELSPDHCHVTLMARPEVTGIKTDRVEKWVGVEYTMQPIPERKLTAWYNVEAHTNIDLPLPNPFIPEDLKILNRPTIVQAPPITIVDEEEGKVHFSADTRYLVPEIAWHFRISTPELDGQTENNILADLYVKSIKEGFNSVSYQGLLAGLFLDVSHKNTYIEVSLQGYSEKAKLMLEEIFDGLKTIKPTEAEFELYRQSLRRQYQNFTKESPLQQSKEILESVLYEDYTTMEKKAENIDYISYEDFLAFTETLYKSSYVEGMLYGNMVASEVRDIWEDTKSKFTGFPYPVSKHNRQELLVLPQSVGPFYIVEKTERQGNAVLLMLQNGPFSFKNRAAQQLLSSGLQEPFFSTLRTKQQTGYIVWNWEREIERQLYSFFAVQSNTHNVRDLLARFELFLESFLQEFTSEEFPDDRFGVMKQALITQLTQPRKNLQEMGMHLKTLAFDYGGDFDWLGKRIQGVEELTYPEFLDLARDFIGRSNKQRLAILMKGTLPEENSFYYYRVNTSNQMRTISNYVPREAAR